MSQVTLFKSKLKNIHTVLMQAYENTRGFTTPVQGDEREVVIRELLQLILPVSYRLGKGAIIDPHGHETGQVDAVFEKPFSLSFPISSETNRIYLADNVAAAFEIKSDLYRQAGEAVEKAREIKELRRKPTEGKIVLYDELYVPTFIIGFKGYKTVKSLYAQFIPNALAADHINAILVLETGVFLGRAPARYENGKKVSESGWYEMEDNPEAALLMFFDCLSNTLKHRANVDVDLLSYSSLIAQAPANLAAPAAGKATGENEK
jgi:hypothetical protein